MQIHQLIHDKWTTLDWDTHHFYKSLHKLMLDSEKRGVNDFVFLFYPTKLRKKIIDLNIFFDIDLISKNKVDVFSFGYKLTSKSKIFTEKIEIRGKQKLLNIAIEKIIKDLTSETKIDKIKLPCMIHFSFKNGEILDQGEIRTFGHIKSQKAQLQSIVKEISYICTLISDKEVKEKSLSGLVNEEYKWIFKGYLIENILDKIFEII